jgi:tRNA(His) 5'-end guanylyltransferase
LNMLASSYYSHEELLNKSAAEKHEMIHAQGDNWAKHPADFKRGRVVRREGEGRAARWQVDTQIPVFTRDRSYLDLLIPLPD